MKFAQEFRPVTNAEYFNELASGGSEIGSNVHALAGRELLDVLRVQREPWLWYAIVFGMNYDLEDSSDVAAWILDQDDCDPMIAIAAFGAMGGPDFCVDPDGSFGLGKVLKVITARVDSRPYRQSVMRAEGVPLTNCPSIVSDCERALAAKGADAEVPAGLKNLLMTPLNGTAPQIEYMVGEEGLWMVPIQIGQTIN